MGKQLQIFCMASIFLVLFSTIVIAGSDSSDKGGECPSFAPSGTYATDSYGILYYWAAESGSSANTGINCPGTYPGNSALIDNECYVNVGMDKVDGKRDKDSDCWISACVAQNGECTLASGVGSRCGDQASTSWGGKCLALDGGREYDCTKNTATSGLTSLAWRKPGVSGDYAGNNGRRSECCGDGVDDAWTASNAHYFDIETTISNELECGLFDPGQYAIIRYDTEARCYKSNKILDKVSFQQVGCLDSDSTCSETDDKYPCSSAGGTWEAKNACIGIEAASGFGAYTLFSDVSEDLCGVSYDDFLWRLLAGCYDGSSYLGDIGKNSCESSNFDWVEEGICYVSGSPRFAYSKTQCDDAFGQWRTEGCMIETNSQVVYTSIGAKDCGVANSENRYQNGECWRYRTDGTGVCTPESGWQPGVDGSKSLCRQIFLEQHTDTSNINEYFKADVGCCGNVVNDLGQVSNGYICIADSEGIFKWVPTSNSGYVYDIIEDTSHWTETFGTNYFYDIAGTRIRNKQYKVVSDGTSWYSCDAENDAGYFTGVEELTPGGSLIATSGTSKHGFLCFGNENITGVINENTESHTNLRTDICEYESVELSKPQVLLSPPLGGEYTGNFMDDVRLRFTDDTYKEYRCQVDGTAETHSRRRLSTSDYYINIFPGESVKLIVDGVDYLFSCSSPNENIYEILEISSSDIDFFKVFLSGHFYDYLCDYSDESIITNYLEIESEPVSSENFVECSYSGNPLNTHTPDNLNLVIPLGDYYKAGNTAHFCAGYSGNTYFTDDLDETFKSAESCDIAKMPFVDDVLDNQDGNLGFDSFKATGKYCCGDDFVEGYYKNNDKFEYFEDTSKNSDGIKYACWNNHVIAENESLSNGRFTSNLIRNSDFEKSLNEDKLENYNWNIEGDVTVDSSIVNAMKFSFNFNPEVSFSQAVISPEHTIHSTNRNEYVLSFDYDINLVTYGEDLTETLLSTFGLEVIIQSIDGTIISQESYPVEGYSEISIPFMSTLELINFSIIVNAEPEATISINNIKLVPKNLVVNEGGNIFACTNEFGINPLSSKTDTITGELIFNESSPYCSDIKGEHRCSPEGFWVPQNDGRDERDTISISPNIIEDSNLDFGSIFRDIDGCELIRQQDGETKSQKSDDPVITENTVIGDNHIVCSLSSPVEINISDSNGKTLEFGNYFFSAWFKGIGGSFYVGNNSASSVNPNSTSWERFFSEGSSNNDGTVSITLNGNFEMDSVQLEKKNNKQFQPGSYFNTESRRSCCHGPYECWNGHECEDMSDLVNGVPKGYSQLLDPNFINNNKESGYLCLGGSYEYVTKKYRWNTKDQFLPEFGFCPESSCFVGTYCEEKLFDPFCISSKSQFSKPGVDKRTCIANGEEFYGYVCENEEWSSKSEDLVSTLFDYAQNSLPYSLFCGDYEDVLNHYEYMDFAEDENIDTWNILENPVPNGENPFIPLVSKACVLLSNGGYSLAVGLSLHDNVSNEGVSDVMRYFRLRPGTCKETEGNSFVSCGNHIFYNHDSRALVYLSRSSIKDVPEVLYQVEMVDKLVQNLYLSAQNFSNSLFADDDVVYSETLEKIRKYEDVYIFDDGENKIEVFKDKIVDPLTEGYKYLYLVSMTNFELNTEFIETYDVDFSPANLTREIQFYDTFDVSLGDKRRSYAFTSESGNIAAIGLGDNPRKHDHHDEWYKFTGKLRGDVSLN